MTRNMSEPYRTESEIAWRYWLTRGRKLMGDPNSSGSALRAASIGVQSIDPVLSHSLATRASVAINRFTQKHKL